VSIICVYPISNRAIGNWFYDKLFITAVKIVVGLFLGLTAALLNAVAENNMNK
jgi:hypothetical protein